MEVKPPAAELTITARAWCIQQGYYNTVRYVSGGTLDRANC